MARVAAQMDDRCRSLSVQGLGAGEPQLGRKADERPRIRAKDDRQPRAVDRGRPPWISKDVPASCSYELPVAIN